MRWAAKTDADHELLLETLRGVGWLVIDTHRVPNFVDAVGYRHSHGVQLFEFKQARGTFTKSQQRLRAVGWPIVVLRSVADVLALTKVRA